MEKEIDQIKEEEKLIHKENLIKQNRPFLLTRFVAAFIDFLIMIIMFIVLLTCLEPIIINSTNYSNYVNNAQQVIIDSGLVNTNDDNIYSKKEYDKNEYDKVITNYYSSDTYAIENNKLEDYNNAKIESTFYTKIDNNFILNSDVDEKKLENFLTDQYEKALSFVKTNPIYIQNLNKSFTIFYMVIILFVAIDVTILYLIIPICRKNGETIGQMIFKMKLIDTRSISRVKKWQILVRYIILLAFDYLLGATIYLKFGPGLMLLPILITTFCISLTKLNVGPHDLISRTMIISGKDI